MMRHLAVDPRTVETIHPHPTHPNSYTPFTTSIANSKDDAIAKFRICNTRTMIFTDGSSTGRKVGAAASLYVDYNHIATLRFHLGDDTEHTVFEAEAVGLILAAQLLSTRNEATFPATIFADNQALIKSGARPTAKSGHYLLFRFRKLVQHLQEKKDLDDKAINLNWIASVSQSVDLGQNNNPNTTPTKDYENVRVVVYLRSVQKGCAEEGERGSTPIG